MSGQTDPRLNDSEDDQILKAAANIMVMSTYPMVVSQKDRGSVVTQTYTENESEVSLMFKKGMESYEAITQQRNSLQRKPETSYQKTRSKF